MSGRRTIRLRLTLWYGGIFCVSSVIVLVMTYALVDRTLTETPQRVREELGVAGDPLGGPPRGTIFGPPGTNVGGDRQARQAIVSAVQDSIRDDVLDKLLRRSVFVFAATALLAFGAGWVVAGRALRPVHAITATARGLSESNLAARVSHQGPDDELKEMADTFDALLDRLERAFESQRRFVAAASHELRSPLTIMRARAEIPAAGASSDAETVADLRAVVVDQVERADRLIDALLTLTRSQGTLIASERIDLAEVVGEVLGTLSQRATAAKVVLDATIDDAEVSGDGPLLERLVGNLVENAIRYNVEGGRVDVRVSGGTAPRLVVENDGPVIDAPAVASLLEPFRRGGTQRTGDGYGLGLAVVHAVAQAHGARLDLQPRPDGGLTVEVVFPPSRVGDASRRASVS